MSRYYNKFALGVPPPDNNWILPHFLPDLPQRKALLKDSNLKAEFNT